MHAQEALIENDLRVMVEVDFSASLILDDFSESPSSELIKVYKIAWFAFECQK